MIGEEEIRTRIVEMMHRHIGQEWKIKSIARYTVLSTKPIWVAVAEAEDGKLQEGVFSQDMHGVMCYEQPIYRASQYERDAQSGEGVSV